MATCKDCLHYEACVEMLRAMGYTCDGDGQDADKRCGTFASNAEYQELLSTAARLAVENTALKDKYKKLRETADILDEALREYQQKYGE